jgi:hypothetical protein
MKITRIEFKDEMGNPDNYDCTFLPQTQSGHHIKEITQHASQGEGDKWFWTIVFEDGSEVMIFNPTKIVKIKDEVIEC